MLGADLRSGEATVSGLDASGPPPGVAAASLRDGERDTAPGPRRILVVEDQAIIAMEIEDVLLELGFEVVGVARDAEEAVELTAALRPDLVTDINLGRGRDGISAAVEIFGRFGVRCVFVSAYGNAETVARAEPARPLGWVAKPVSRAALQVALSPSHGDAP